MLCKIFTSGGNYETNVVKNQDLRSHSVHGYRHGNRYLHLGASNPFVDPDHIIRRPGLPDDAMVEWNNLLAYGAKVFNLRN